MPSLWQTVHTCVPEDSAYVSVLHDAMVKPLQNKPHGLQISDGCKFLFTVGTWDIISSCDFACVEPGPGRRGSLPTESTNNNKFVPNRKPRVSETSFFLVVSPRNRNYVAAYFARHVDEEQMQFNTLMVLLIYKRSTGSCFQKLPSPSASLLQIGPLPGRHFEASCAQKSHAHIFGVTTTRARGGDTYQKSPAHFDCPTRKQHPLSV